MTIKCKYDFISDGSHVTSAVGDNNAAQVAITDLENGSKQISFTRCVSHGVVVTTTIQVSVEAFAALRHMMREVY